MTGKPKKWAAGDLVQVGRVRWVIRAIAGDRVVLEAMNTASIWWDTTINQLPRRATS